MVRRSESQWQALFKAHQQSGLSVTQFCRDHKLDPKYFSLRRKQLSVVEQSSFIQLTPASGVSATSTRGPEVSRLRVIDLEFGAELNVDALSSFLSGLLR